MPFNLKDTKETIRIKNNKIAVTTKVFSGKDGDFFIAISPTLHVSGYGDTAKDAEQAFENNMELFCRDLMALSIIDIDKEVRKLGFKKELYKNKNYSKLFIDESGVLQGLEKGTLKASMLEAAY